MGSNTAMKAYAKLRLKFQSKEELEVIFRALAPEAAKPATPRSRVSLTIDDSSLIVVIEAKDTTALRATINAYLRWIHSISKVLNALKTY